MPGSAASLSNGSLTGRSPFQTEIEMEIEVCANPVFVVGAPRSGTSMLQMCLRRHSKLWGGQESDYLGPLIQNLRACYDFGCRRKRLHWLSGQNVSWHEFLRHIGYGVNLLYVSRSQGRRWVEQTPLYTLHLPGLSEMFPGARFLFMLRDGRQVVHSLRHFVEPRRHRAACQTWLAYTRAGIEFAASSQGWRLHTVRFDAIVNQPEFELQRVCRFLDLEYEPGPARFLREKPPINSSFPGEKSADKLRPRWPTWSASEKRLFQRICGALLVELGFEPDGSWVTRRAA